MLPRLHSHKVRTSEGSTEHQAPGHPIPAPPTRVRTSASPDVSGTERADSRGIEENPLLVSGQHSQHMSTSAVPARGWHDECRRTPITCP
eukprot:13694527-Alexandrium_andersonii.AAC.1